MQSITNRVRKLRQNQTEAETRMWALLRNRKLGVKIVRQKPILIDYFGKTKAFIADFYCSEANLVIEIDGSVHEKQVDYDQLRTSLLKQKGLEMIRFTNNEVLNTESEVIEKLKKVIYRCCQKFS